MTLILDNDKIHFFVLSLPHSDGISVKAYPAEATEAFCDGHISAFRFLRGVPQSILYDNTKLAVAKILGDGRRARTRVFTELQPHYLFTDKFGRPGRGNDKGNVEGWSAIVVVTSSCPSRRSIASTPSTFISRDAALSAWRQGSGDTLRR